MILWTRFWKLIILFIKELSDENAYRRHLAVSGRPHSRAEWQRFCGERLRYKYGYPKCC